MEILDNIPTNLDSEDVMRRLHHHRGLEPYVEELVEAVRPIVRPKAIYEVSYVEDRTEDSVRIGGVRFTSRVLRRNLEPVGKVFPHVVTCGREIDEMAVSSDDLMESYCLDTIKEIVLRSAARHLQDYLSARYAVGRLSKMSPGALTDWPITQQEKLFSIFGNVEDMIGVRLTESSLMVPVKSVSGIYFPSEVGFESCQLCPRDVCERRRAPYDPALATEYGVAAHVG